MIKNEYYHTAFIDSIFPFFSVLELYSINLNHCILITKGNNNYLPFKNLTKKVSTKKSRKTSKEFLID